MQEVGRDEQFASKTATHLSPLSSAEPIDGEPQTEKSSKSPQDDDASQMNPAQPGQEQQTDLAAEIACVSERNLHCEGQEHGPTDCDFVECEPSQAPGDQVSDQDSDQVETSNKTEMRMNASAFESIAIMSPKSLDGGHFEAYSDVLRPVTEELEAEQSCQSLLEEAKPAS